MALTIVLAAVAGFVVLAAAIGGWAFWLIRRRSAPDPRERLLMLASMAASDDSGRGLLALLRELASTPGPHPVTVGWLARHTAKDDGKGFLVKIAWDGNEWRRAIAPGALRAALEGAIAADPALDGPEARRLLADLREAETN